IRTGRTQVEAGRAAGETAENSQDTGRNVPEQAPEAPIEPIRKRVLAIDQQIEHAVASLNEYSRSMQRELEFSIDRELGRPIVQVIDQRTKEVIRQIPNDVTLNLARNLQSDAPGP
ncbi:MAG: flagellar protein FlaG, partial [Rhodobacteraceae bacterium]|nr:flagellar protein FlaG [Paracoccaceae bacterium]